MILISTRESLQNSDEYAPVNSYYRLKFSKGGAAEATVQSLAVIRKTLKNKKILLLIHGFNNDFADVSRAYNIIEKKMSSIHHDYDEVVGFTWPGGDQGYEYHPAKRRSSVAAGRLLDIFDIFQTRTLDVMTHSMGARIVLRALRDLTPDNSFVIRNHFSTAAAVDDESIEKNEQFHAATQLIEHNWVFHSKYDSVLKYWYKAGELDTALGLHGPDDRQAIERHSKNVKVINCRHVVKGHGDYKNSAEFYRFLSEILNHQVPVSRQFFTLYA